MEIRETFRVPVSPAITYRALNDVGGIGECIAGVQEVSVLDEDRSRWKLEVRAGFMALQIALDARIVERVEGRRIAFAAEGQDVTLTGHVHLDNAIDGTTDCDVFIDAVIGGPLGPMADLMARGPQEALVAETVSNIRDRLQAMAPETPGVNGAEPARAREAVRPSASTGRPRVSFAAPRGRAVDMVVGAMLLVVGLAIGRRLGK